MTYKGSCHCGRIAFEVDGELAQAIECNCPHCSRKGYLLWFVARDQLRVLSPENESGTYRFKKHVIEHHFWPACGCAPFGIGIDGDARGRAAVNVRCLEGIDLSSLKRAQFDGRSL